ncbi:MAG: 3-deoxy-manno-octulosonate cytidylyltransferase [Bryobacteraceae bacterium]
MPTRVLGVIPARFASSRFPAKALATLAGKTMLQHVWERASATRYLSSVVIATDHDSIYNEARRFGAQVRMTRSDHASGTDRVAEIAASDSASVVVNIQGDEPLIDPAAIDGLVHAMLDREEVRMGTLKKKIEHAPEIANPNVVKVVTDRDGDAIYFSRCPIPFQRESGDQPTTYFKHIGLYAYNREFLLGYSDLPVGPLERAEKLEQLRALENGYRIHVVETDYDSLGVDTPEDLERLRAVVEALCSRQ